MIYPYVFFIFPKPRSSLKGFYLDSLEDIQSNVMIVLKDFLMHQKTTEWSLKFAVGLYSGLIQSSLHFVIFFVKDLC
jgi:hypothetical protein